MDSHIKKLPPHSIAAEWTVLGAILFDMVKKKRDGQEVVVNDDDSDEETVYHFGVREKTRFDPYHIYLTLNPDRGFELAPDPQEDVLKNMHQVLLKYGVVNKTTFINYCREELSIGEKKLRNLVGIGRGKYWKIETRKEEKNAQYVIPNQFGSSAPPI